MCIPIVARKGERSGPKKIGNGAKPLSVVAAYATVIKLSADTTRRKPSLKIDYVIEYIGNE